MLKFHIDTQKQEQKHINQISQQHLKPLKPNGKAYVKLIKG